jgi:lipopolysaccharide export system protein LptA
MNKQKTAMIILLGLVFPYAIANAQLNIEKNDFIRKNQPIEIVSDRMEAFNEKKMVVFSGNAVATQGDIRLKTDKLFFYYQKKDDARKTSPSQAVETSTDLDRIEAKGNVVIEQKDMTASSDEAVYFQSNAQIVMTGNAVLREGKNIIKGCRVIIYLDESRGKVEQCESEKSGRVRAIIHPQETP